MEQKQIIRFDPDKNDSLKLIFGPHHYVNITKDNDEIKFELGCTHHGVKFDATLVNSELYNVIEFLRDKFPKNKTD